MSVFYCTCVEELAEGLQIAVRDVDDFLTDIDAVVAVNLLNLVNGNDVGAMDTQKLIFGQHVLYGFHRQVGDQWFWLVVEIKHHIVFHTIDVGDLIDGYITPFAINPDEKSI